jgi:hypothetical protein
MNRLFIRTTHYPEQRTVVRLDVSAGKVRCNCKKDMQETQAYTYLCRDCREEFMGPLLETAN